MWRLRQRTGFALLTILWFVPIVGLASAATFAFQAVYTSTVNIPFAEVAANPISYGDTSNLPNFGAGLSHGDIIHGSFSYDLSAANLDTREGIGRYLGQELSLLLPSHPLVSLNPNITLGFGIEFPSDGANFSINSRIVNLSAPPGHTVQYSFGIAFHKALDSTALPTGFNLADFGTVYVIIFAIDTWTGEPRPEGNTFGSELHYFRLTQIERIDQIPIPAALHLFAVSIGLMGLLGWRRRSAARHRERA